MAEGSKIQLNKLELAVGEVPCDVDSDLKNTFMHTICFMLNDLGLPNCTFHQVTVMHGRSYHKFPALCNKLESSVSKQCN